MAVPTLTSAAHTQTTHTQVTYGYHMAIGMAVGLLFLGGGRLTISTSKPAIAALLAALFPRFPNSPSDNRYHLQAFRHLYARVSCSIPCCPCRS